MSTEQNEHKCLFATDDFDCELGLETSCTDCKVAVVVKSLQDKVRRLERELRQLYENNDRL